MRSTDDRRRQGKGDSQRGVTVIELVITVLIGMVLAGLAAGAMFSAVASYRLSSAARSLAASAQLAKIKATARDAQYRVVIDASARTYRIEYRARGSTSWVLDPGSADISLPPRVDFITATVSSPPAGQSGGPDTDMTFNTRGLLVSGSGPINSRCFYLQGSSAQVLGVCSTLAGKTTVYRQSGTSWEVM